jgi:hypothetical protein
LGCQPATSKWARKQHIPYKGLIPLVPLHLMKKMDKGKLPKGGVRDQEEEGI